jgi:prephenate dehydrogenase
MTAIVLDLAIIVIGSSLCGYLIGRWVERRSRRAQLISQEERERNIRARLDRANAERDAARARHPDLVQLGVEMGVYPPGTLSVNNRPVIPADAGSHP